MTRFIRWCGLAAVAGGIFIILARVFQVVLFGDASLRVHAASPLFLPLLGIPALIGSMGFLIGVVGLQIRQVNRSGSFGLIIFLLAFAGGALSLGANWTYAFATPLLHALQPELLDANLSLPVWRTLGNGLLISYLAGAAGWLLMGLSVLVAGSLPRWVGLMIIASILSAGLAPLSTNGPWGLLVNILIAIGPMGAGYALWAFPGGRN